MPSIDFMAEVKRVTLCYFDTQLSRMTARFRTDARVKKSIAASETSGWCVDSQCKEVYILVNKVTDAVIGRVL